MVYMHQDDETLVMLTLAGEQRAYEVLVVRYQKNVIAAARAVTHNDFMAEDAAQDAFVTAWMKLDTLQEPKKYVSWVCRIARNCAYNMLGRFRAFLPLCDMENIIPSDDPESNPEERFVVSEENAKLHENISKLPEKIREIIRLHYFEGLSVVEIADRMRIPAGTVKWQLHDGRKRIRKELCAMNEKENDTLTEKVMKKVEELKLWQLKNSKDGFAEVYADVLAEVENLPESKKKYHALADVLMRGWWWLEGEKNDELFARIKAAAEAGKNEEVMDFIAIREENLVWDNGAREDFIREKQIPQLEKAGFRDALAAAWIRLGKIYAMESKCRPDEAKAAFEKAKAAAPKGSFYYALADESAKITDICPLYIEKNTRFYSIAVTAYDIRIINGEPHYFSEDYGLRNGDEYIMEAGNNILRNASRCDGKFFIAGLVEGETYTGSDGTTLTYTGSESITTPCGTFDDCRLWVTKYHEKYSGELTIYKTYYKDGIGIVKQESISGLISDTRMLCAYSIAGGDGLMPLAAGNTWEYLSDCADDAAKIRPCFTVASADGGSAVIVSSEENERIRYDENSWAEMMLLIREGYNKKENGRQRLCDVSHAMERAEALADTPYRKLHTKTALSVMRRIMETDAYMTPNRKAAGRWNFFGYNNIKEKAGSISEARNHKWSFEWKITGTGYIGEDMTLYNDVYGLLVDCANALWCDEWRPGAEPTVEFDRSEHRKTKIRCEECEPITTKAGTFENCLKLTLTTTGLENAAGREYRGFDKTYYFADGIGIVRADFVCCYGVKTVTYELTEYEGTGEGYMPICDGMMRRYDGLDIPDGHISYAIYNYAKNDTGELVILADRCGIRMKPPVMTNYGDICYELGEDIFWDKKEYWKCRELHDLNNFRIMVHYLCRNQPYTGKPNKAVAWHKNTIRMIEGFGDGEVPPAWRMRYFRSHFVCGTALFGAGKKEEGYEYIEKAFELYEKFRDTPRNEPLDVGNEEIFGGVKIEIATGVMTLPDGSRDICPEWSGDSSASWMYYGMTTKRGWEWFNSVRDEERFKKCIERARKLMEEEEKM